MLCLLVLLHHRVGCMLCMPIYVCLAKAHQCTCTVVILKYWYMSTASGIHVHIHVDIIDFLIISHKQCPVKNTSQQNGSGSSNDAGLGCSSPSRLTFPALRACFAESVALRFLVFSTSFAFFSAASTKTELPLYNILNCNCCGCQSSDVGC